MGHIDVQARVVRALALSKSRRRVVSVGQDEHHSVVVFRPSNGLRTDGTLGCTNEQNHALALKFVAGTLWLEWRNYMVYDTPLDVEKHLAGIFRDSNRNC